MSGPLFAPWDLIDAERQRCRVVHLSGWLKVVRSQGRVSYQCPWEGVELFYIVREGPRERAVITLEGEENWARRYTCPLNCNHFRWWLHWTRDLTGPAMLHLTKRSDAILVGSQLAFVLLRKKWTARWGALGGKWVPR